MGVRKGPSGGWQRRTWTSGRRHAIIAAKRRAGGRAGAHLLRCRGPRVGIAASRCEDNIAYSEVYGGTDFVIILMIGDWIYFCKELHFLDTVIIIIIITITNEYYLRDVNFEVTLELRQ